jgi:hypothetical protein
MMAGVKCLLLNRDRICFIAARAQATRWLNPKNMAGSTVDDPPC